MNEELREARNKLLASIISVRQFKDWEIQILLLLSFTLQLFLFFFGGLRRRTTNALLRLLIWLTYLSADLIAVYALGYLSRHLPITTDGDGCCQAYIEKNLLPSQCHHHFTVLWAPFLLIHLGGQDTVTAFSIEDNELWLRHLLNMLAQVCLVLYVLWSFMAHSQHAIPAVFLFLSGFIKYGERIWALKCGKQKSLKNSTGSQVLKKQPGNDDGRQEDDRHEDGTKVKYSSIVRHALRSMPVLREVFTGSKLNQAVLLERTVLNYYQYVDHPTQGDGAREAFFHSEMCAREAFKRIEIELSMIYDDLYTKAKLIQTRNGTILRGVSLTSTTVAFVLFVLMSGRRRHYNYTGPVDVAITYTLFVGTFFLEACAIVTAMVTPRAWASMEARDGGCSLLARATWSIFAMIQPETRPWWSNSMGQYNFVSSVLADDKSRIAKMMGAAGAQELWRNFRHVEYVKVTPATEKLVHQATENCKLRSTLNISNELYRAIVRRPFEEALLLMHVCTDLFLYRASKTGVAMSISPEINIAEMRILKDTCKVISDYMFFLLIMQPAMLPVGSSVHDLLAAAEKSVRDTRASSKEQFLEEVVARQQDGSPVNRYRLAGMIFEAGRMEKMLLQQGQGNFHASLQLLVDVWVRLLVYAAGKSRPEEHARRLSMGGELLTFVWLLLAHCGLGDVNLEVSLSRRSEFRGRGISVLFHCAEQIDP